jgi:hypothetical protein
MQIMSASSTIMMPEAMTLVEFQYCLYLMVRYLTFSSIFLYLKSVLPEI